MKHFGGYLRSRLGTIILCVCLFGVFAAADLLFEVETIVLWYPLILGAVLLLVVGAVDYVMFLKKHKELSYGEPPTPKSLIEEDYQSIIAKLKEEAEMRASSASQDYNNMIEYYTVWAHQIKTPIAAMRLNLQSEDSESARKLMGDLNRIESYVEMVLTFLRLDSDSTDYVIKEHDLDEIIKSSVRKFSREFILKKLTLNYEPVKYKCITDEKWLEFIIEQVISNAVKYTSEGGVRISGDGVEIGGKAESYAATGKVTGGKTFFGIKIDVSIEGKAGGAGVEGGFMANDSSVSAKLGAGLGLGAGVELTVDWSGAGKFFDDVGQGIQGFAEGVGQGVQNFFDNVWNAWSGR